MKLSSIPLPQQAVAAASVTDHMLTAAKPQQISILLKHSPANSSHQKRLVTF